MQPLGWVQLAASAGLTAVGVGLAGDIWKDYQHYFLIFGMAGVLYTLLMHHVDSKIDEVEQRLGRRIEAWGVKLKSTPREKLMEFVERLDANIELRKQAIAELEQTPNFHKRYVRWRIEGYENVRGSYRALLREFVPDHSKAEELELAEIGIGDFHSETKLLRQRALELLKRVD